MITMHPTTFSAAGTPNEETDNLREERRYFFLHKFRRRRKGVARSLHDPLCLFTLSTLPPPLPQILSVRRRMHAAGGQS